MVSPNQETTQNKQILKALHISVTRKTQIGSENRLCTDYSVLRDPKTDQAVETSFELYSKPVNWFTVTLKETCVTIQLETSLSFLSKQKTVVT